MKLKLIIKKEDGSEYWREHFNTIEAADAWLETEQTRPYWVDSYTSELIDITEYVDPAVVALQKSNAEARAYLASTDWYVIRQMERGIEIPDDVKAARLDAVNRIQ
jgi:LmbE family N-acetylglucosaminyl deacetylase